MQLDDFRGALREYRMLTRIQPRTATHFEAAAIAANRLGDKARSRNSTPAARWRSIRSPPFAPCWVRDTPAVVV